MAGEREPGWAMSKHKKYLRYQKKRHGTLLVTQQEQFVLRVLAEAEKAGRKAGRKSAKRSLKQARQQAQLSQTERKQLLDAAERTGAAAALGRARKTLDKNLGSRPARQEPAHHPAAAAAGAPSSTAPAPVVDGAAVLQDMGQHVLTIRRIERLSPQMVRIVAGAPGLAGYRPNDRADQYVKVYFADPKLGLVPPYDLKALRQRLRREDMPRSRSYTVRWVDEAAEELAIDFVLHADPGSAGAWAAAARIGEPMVISSARGKFSPRSTAPYFIFAADEAGIPAISCALSMLPDNAQGAAVLEVADAEGELEIPHPVGIELRWLHRNGRKPGTTNLLPQALADLPQPPRETSVMAHCERTAAKAISHTVAGWGLEKGAWHVSSYWTLRRAKERH